MDIIGLKLCPAQLEDIITEAFAGLEDHVECIIIDADLPEMHGHVGAIDVGRGKTYNVLIDLKNCVESTYWCEKGMLYLPNVWYNILYAIFHERAHVKQLVDDPSLAEDLEHSREIMEYAADLEAIECLFNWSKKNTVPKLNEMGWAGEQIKLVLNGMYASNSAIVDEEIDTMHTGAAARAAVTGSRAPSFSSAEEITSLVEHIKDGVLGQVIKGQCYLSGEEFFGLHSTQPTIKEEEE